MAENGIDAPVLVDNDANFAALAEWTWGTGRGLDYFLYVSASKGVGGGLIIDGRVYRGGTGMAGDLGHLVVEPNGAMCYCGSRGCLPTLISERAILSALRASQTQKGSLDEVILSAQQGDPACQRVLAEAGRYLDDGQFPPGSMGPKIESALRFLADGGELAVITSPGLLAATLAGGQRSGTRIERSPSQAGPGWASR